LSLSLMLLHQHPIRTTPLFVTCHIPRPSHSSWFDHLKSIWWVQSTKLLIVVLNLWFLRPWGLTRWYMLSVGWLPTFRRNFVQHSDPIYTCLHERRRFWILNLINQDVICNRGMKWREWSRSSPLTTPNVVVQTNKSTNTCLRRQWLRIALK
jgi:hypothetical protein